MLDYGNSIFSNAQPGNRKLFSIVQICWLREMMLYELGFLKRNNVTREAGEGDRHQMDEEQVE